MNAHMTFLVYFAGVETEFATLVEDLKPFVDFHIDFRNGILARIPLPSDPRRRSPSQFPIEKSCYRPTPLLNRSERVSQGADWFIRRNLCRRGIS